MIEHLNAVSFPAFESQRQAWVACAVGVAPVAFGLVRDRGINSSWASV